jgi:hypothetical protein
VEKALRLWKPAFEREPWRGSIGMNLARVDCNLGNSSDARASIKRVLQFNPDFPEARSFLHGIETRTISCGQN